MAIVIGLATVILVYAAYGYGINTKTGQVIQNGLLYVDSKPGGADIYLNGQKQSAQTGARLVLNAGDYNLAIKKSGYQNWQRSFVLDEHTIARYVYPFLFPTKPYTLNLKTYGSMPTLITQSPDRRWLLVQAPESTQGNLLFDEYDLNALSKGSTVLTLPKSIITPAESSTYKPVEWSSNNNQLLLEHSYPGGSEFLVFNRSRPDESFNVNKLFKVDPTQVALKNKKADQLYLYTQDGGTLQLGDVGQGSLAEPLLRHVLAFKPYGNSIIDYITNTGAPSGKVTARIWDNGKNFTVYSFEAGDKYLIDAAQFQGHWYFAAGSDKSDRLEIFKDPEDSIKNPNYRKAIAMAALANPGASSLSFSENTRFIAAQSGQTFTVYDLENSENYRYTIKTPISSDLKWMDGHRFIGQAENRVRIFDYDNRNHMSLTPSALSSGGFFSSDYNQLVTFINTDSGVVFQRIDLRAGNDLPANRAE